MRESNARTDFYSSRTVNRAYVLPHSTKDEDIIGIMHDHSILSRIFWPHVLVASLSEDGFVSGVSNFNVGLVNTSFRASIVNQPTGVICTEEMFLGIKFTVSYTVAGDYQSYDGITDRTTELEKTPGLNPVHSSSSAPSQNTYLVEKRTISALKPILWIVKMKEEDTIVKTKNLLQVLESLGGSKIDILSAMADLN